MSILKSIRHFEIKMAATENFDFYGELVDLLVYIIFALSEGRYVI